MSDHGMKEARGWEPDVRRGQEPAHTLRRFAARYKEEAAQAFLANDMEKANTLKELAETLLKQAETLPPFSPPVTRG